MFNFGSRRLFGSILIVLSILVLSVAGQDRSRNLSRQSVPEHVITSYTMTHYPLGVLAGKTASSPDVVNPNSFYSNVTNFAGSALINGGAAPDPGQAGNTITRLLADDLTLLNVLGAPPYTVTQYNLAIANTGTTTVPLGRLRTRFWLADGAGGGPGTLITLISFSPATGNTSIAIAPGVTIFQSAQLGALNFNVTSRNIWAGVAFDDNGGTSGATIADLNSLGMGVFDPVDRGTSADLSFLTTTNGAFGSANPPGTISNTAGVVDRLGWELNGAAPVTAGGVTLSGRVTNSDGRGVTNAVISLADPSGGVVTVTTDRQGRFSFEDVASGRTYVITAASRRFTFDPASQVITVTDNLSDINFTGAPAN